MRGPQKQNEEKQWETEQQTAVFAQALSKTDWLLVLLSEQTCTDAHSPVATDQSMQCVLFFKVLHFPRLCLLWLCELKHPGGERKNDEHKAVWRTSGMAFTEAYSLVESSISHHSSACWPSWLLMTQFSLGIPLDCGPSKACCDLLRKPWLMGSD